MDDDDGEEISVLTFLAAIFILAAIGFWVLGK